MPEEYTPPPFFFFLDFANSRLPLKNNPFFFRGNGCEHGIRFGTVVGLVNRNILILLIAYITLWLSARDISKQGFK